MNKYIDFHCHVLPGMDFDGTEDVRETVAMCELLKSQGVATICATPHFYPWKQINVTDFVLSFSFYLIFPLRDAKTTMVSEIANPTTSIVTLEIQYKVSVGSV